MIIPPALIEKAVSLFAPVAAKLSSPVVKWSFIATVLVMTNLYTWHHMTLVCERERTEAIDAQAKVFAERELKVMRDREQVYQELNETRQASTQQIINLQKRMVIYERNAKATNVPVPPDSAGMFNAISGLLPPSTGMPGSSPASGKSDESSEARIETTRLLLAYVQAYGHCGEELTELWNDYAALVKAIRAQSEKG